MFARHAMTRGTKRLHDVSSSLPAPVALADVAPWPMGPRQEIFFFISAAASSRRADGSSMLTLRRRSAASSTQFTDELGTHPGMPFMDVTVV